MPPMVIAGAIAAAGTIGGAVLAGNASKSAANTASQAQQQATQAQTQLGQQSLALNQGIYNSNYNLLSPGVSRGNVAGDTINALLGLPPAPQMQSPMAQPTQAMAPPQPTGQTMADIQGMQHDGIPGNYRAAMANYNPMSDAGMVNGGPVPNMGAPQSAPVVSQTPVPGATPTGTNALSPTDAFNNFANSAGMQFQLKQGENAIQSNYADKGALQSGAAMKALQSYGQNTALQNYFMPYLSLLGGQQSTGAQAGAAVAGVGSNFGNTAAGINGQMGNAIQNGADARSNAALVGGANSANIFSGVGNALGNIGSSYFMSRGAGGGVPAPILGMAPVTLPTAQPYSYMPGGF